MQPEWASLSLEAGLAGCKARPRLSISLPLGIPLSPGFLKPHTGPAPSCWLQVSLLVARGLRILPNSKGTHTHSYTHRHVVYSPGKTL